ncbi:MAG: 16S rRNA (cytosine(1402)-N(4))-methyltransferase RsmH [Candidatus Gastranaerophilales bacterium]|nr:16S rRNA (cytosine(1402)-N(4))-methyltransferase RsmH [Candidatus Gastranaerophilales bacterium]
MHEFKHFPVMLNEAVEALECKKGKLYIDATLGGGGYSELILKKISPEGRLISFDIDNYAVEYSKEKLKDYENLTIVNDSYTNIKKYLDENNIKEIDGGIVFDLGASTPQLTSRTRGFSFLNNAKLDMRFNQSADFSAYDVINDYKEDELVKIFSEYGEERFSKRIAKKIIEVRKIKPVETTKELVDIIFEATPRIKSKIHPATRVFQAVRIEVNHELDNIKNTLNDVLTLLGNNAILSIVTFHSLEDRIVKQFIKHYSKEWIGGDWHKPARAWQVSDSIYIPNVKNEYHQPWLEPVIKKPLTASEEEIRVNPPSRSAKLRIARRINKK